MFSIKRKQTKLKNGHIKISFNVLWIRSFRTKLIIKWWNSIELIKQ